MRTGYFDLATRSIVNADEYAVGTWRICRVNTPYAHRHRGHASRLLGEICADADAEMVTLILEPSPDGSPESLSYDELVAFYQRHGFYTLPDSSMRRNPINAESFS